MDYTNLIAGKGVDGSIQNWINNDRVSATTVLTEAEAWIYHRLRVRQMIATQSATMTKDADTVSLPTGFRAPIWFAITGTEHEVLGLETVQEVEARFQYDGDGDQLSAKPQVFYVAASALQMEAPALSAYPYRLVYYQTLTALGPSNKTNFLTDLAPRLLRCCCLAFASEFMKNDADREYWLNHAAGEIGALNAEEDLNKIGIHMDVVPE